MPLLLTLARGAATGLGKRPSARAVLPPVRLTAPPVRIDPARVAAYAEVCGFHPPLRDRDPLPLTYPHVLGFPLTARLMAARDFPLPLMGLVHTSVEIGATALPTLADRPELVVHAEELAPHPRGTQVVVVTQARLDGEAVWTDRSTYLARHRTDRPAPGERPAEPDDLPVLARWELPAGLGRRHARVTGDWNPIHLFPATARPFGFRRAIVHGMWTAARCLAAQPAGVRRFRADFRSPVPLPSTVRYAASGGRFTLRSPAGRLHLSGTAA